MTYESWDIGQQPTITFTLTNAAGVLAAGTVVITMTTPSGVISTPAVTNPSTGIYTVAPTLDEYGTWVFRFASTGAVIDAKDYSIICEPNLAATLYATVDELRESFSDSTGANLNADVLESALHVASRNIDEVCQRRFWPDTAVSARTYSACHPYELRVDDIATVTGLLVKTDTGDNGTYDTSLTVTTNYLTEPSNAVALGRPVSKIVLVNACFPTAGYRPRVQVTARWGWPKVPDQVRRACLIEAARLYRRKDTPEGIAGSGDFGLIRVSRYMDPDAQRLLAPFILRPVLVA